MKIVPLTDEDRVSVRMLELACIREYVETIIGKKWEEFDQEVRQKLGASASGSFSHYRDSGLSFVAKEGDKVVGFVFAQMIPWVDGIEKAIWVENIGVDPEFRRMGIGYMLMRRLAEEGKKMGGNVIHSSISPDNISSLLLHKKLGFLAEDRKIAYLDLSNF
ncbi:MAG TPA: GNAT family N-acetyltransferase [Methanomassiliicoccaceae archaeon]|jgi:ribosomal protein S18 acetylase RimI-like enzyme|nr:GNAT family N-acetyltransferase [Euryarchaeota archaeon]HOB38437.1 GNAT family N-acetyltransferase [Methanomassiliicoccaceae archaeon]HOK27637.1 GNAT family N-acetyltransferase [Methanomassiliicoccaceae archaeon]HOQ25546.1 GNAT family N-acetyltransferase [Methanomassiliicoccaceae archaeon]HPT73962.1 GNAT family N-acetyltransferase [Methanomassiliicoccaceae archaeon]